MAASTAAHEHYITRFNGVKYLLPVGNLLWKPNQYQVVHNVM